MVYSKLDVCPIQRVTGVRRLERLQSGTSWYPHECRKSPVWLCILVTTLRRLQTRSQLSVDTRTVTGARERSDLADVLSARLNLTARAITELQASGLARACRLLRTSNFTVYRPMAVTTQLTSTPIRCEPHVICGID